MPSAVRSEIVVALTPAEAFAVVTQALTDALERDGVTVERAVWRPGERAVLHWPLPGWAGGTHVELELVTSPEADGTRIAVALCGVALGDDPEAPAAWFGSELLAPLIRAAS